MQKAPERKSDHLPTIHFFGGKLALSFREGSIVILYTKLGGGYRFKYFLCSSLLRKDSILTNIFQGGWNHQLEKNATCYIFPWREKEKRRPKQNQFGGSKWVFPGCRCACIFSTWYPGRCVSTISLRWTKTQNYVQTLKTAESFKGVQNRTEMNFPVYKCIVYIYIDLLIDWKIDMFLT